MTVDTVSSHSRIWYTKKGPDQQMDELARWRQHATWNKPCRVVVTSRQSVHPDDIAYAMIREAGADLTIAPFRDETGKISAEAAQAEVLIAGGVGLKEADFAELPNVRFVLRPYMGYDDIDVEAATKHGVLVANVPDAFAIEVANHALSLILALNRELFAMDRYVRSGGWAARRGRANLEIHRPTAVTLGIVGFGGIGRLVAERLRPFGFKLLAADPFVSADQAAAYGATLVTLDELLAQSDVVTLHVFLNKDTRHLMNAAAFAKMKRGAVLVNTCRGPVVDEAALAEALRSGQLGAAGLDVFEEEPIGADHPLCSMEQVILTPHAASQSVEGGNQLRQRVGEIARGAAIGGIPERKAVVNKALYDKIAALPELANIPRA